MAFTKLCAQNSCQLTEEAEVVLHDALISRNTELQQRALELQALLRWGASRSMQRVWRHCLQCCLHPTPQSCLMHKVRPGEDI